MTTVPANLQWLEIDAHVAMVRCSAKATLPAHRQPLEIDAGGATVPYGATLPANLPWLEIDAGVVAMARGCTVTTLQAFQPRRPQTAAVRGAA